MNEYEKYFLVAVFLIILFLAFGTVFYFESLFLKKKLQREVEKTEMLLSIKK